MMVMAASGVPVPRIIWAEDAGGPFGQPYFIGEFVDGC